MTLVNAETGEIVAHCTPDEARRLTDEIKGAAERVWSLLVEAHDREAWAALGYGSWRDYATTEFGMSQSRAYQLLDQGRVVRAIEEATGHSTSVELTEAAARDIKPRLVDVTKAIKEKVTAEATAPEPERVKEIVAEVVAEEREKAKQATEDAQALADLSAAAENAGMDMDESRRQQRGAFARLCRDISGFPEPAVFIAGQGEHLVDRHVLLAERAYAWLDEFLLEVREGK